MRKFERDVLQAIIDCRQANARQLADTSGFAIGTCRRAAEFLHKHGLIDRPRYGTHVATEKGKIVFALIVGKESRARSVVRIVTSPPSVPDDVLAYINGHG
jgi:Mn-dependent DtxR family transcriptional regulator